ncbi:MAG: acylphosphatase [Gemmatimonadetes bacterium]|jgi:acylphosphatase|nr:acylphosphatase [Gemmatimonadota bacterium]MBT6145691.1 acylphosphatase [Gemmatimonadota bacterium]MBT7859218.1 acylphosphatase [Gemmatimonadota bacterium]
MIEKQQVAQETQVLRIRVEGRVQGVGFRYFARAQANRLDLSGFVRNVTDGSVEAEAMGERADLERFVAALERGPGSGRVERCVVDWTVSVDTYKDFVIRP